MPTEKELFQNREPLHDYQEFAKDFVIKTPRCGLFLDMGLGKAIDDDTVIPTPQGFQRLGNILPGDTVFDMTGHPATVTQVFKHTDKDAFKVTLSDGRSFICCDEHLLPLCPNGNPDNVIPVPLKDIMDDYKKATPDGTVFPYMIPRADTIQYPKRQHDIAPDIMGVILRHGRLTATELVFLDDPDSNYIYGLQQRLCPAHLDPDGVWRLNGASIQSTLHQALLGMGYQPDQPLDFIPDQYLCDDSLSRRDLLLGYLDVPVQDTMKPLKLQVSSEHLAHQIKQLVWSMGMSVVSSWKPRKKVTELNMLLVKQHDPVHSQKPPVHGSILQIVDIEPVGKRNMTCFTVSNMTHTYLINDYIVTHNTRITLEALLELNPSSHVLIIAPLTIAKATWTAEIKKWHMPIRTKSFIVNENNKKLTRKKRLELYQAAETDLPTVYFINRELFCDLVENMPIRQGRPVWLFPTVIIDECQSFKSHKSERFKAMKRVLPATTRIIELTGTPMPEGLMDLWSEIYILDGGARLGRNITAYRNTFFRPSLYVNGYPVKWTPLPGAEEEIYRRIGDLVISMKNSNMQLPPTYTDIAVDMLPDEVKMYRQFRKESVLELAGNDPIEAVNRGVLYNKLAQMASGSVYTDQSGNYVVIHKHKLEACEHIINNSFGNVIITYHYQASREMLKEYFPTAVVFDGSPQMIDQWNEGLIPIMLLQPASGGFGLNLQYGGHTMIWYDLYANLEEYLQCNARLARQGQKYPVMIYHLLANDTLDKYTLNLLSSKDDSQNRLLDAVEAVIQDVKETT